MTKLGLTLNEAKTSVKNARTERFDFLGYTFGPHCYQRNGNRYLGASPSAKSVRRVKLKVNQVLVPGNMKPWPNVRDQLNRLLRGWSAYFCYGSRGGHTKRLIITSADAFDTSSVGGIRYQTAEQDDFPMPRFMGASEFCRWITAVCLNNETSRKAGCG